MHRSPRLVGTVALLILALVVCAVLAYQAWDAGKSQQQTADSALNDYAKIADWQLTQQAKNALLTQVVTSLLSPASLVNPDSLRQTLISPVQVEDVARRMAGFCGCLGGIRYFFRYDWHEGTFRTTETELPDADLAWARDTVVAFARTMPPPDRGILTFGSPDGRSGAIKNLAVILTNDSYAMVFGERNGKQVLLVFVVAREAERGDPVVVYGYATDPWSYIAPVLDTIRGRNSGRGTLLAESVVHGLQTDSILAISVRTLNNREIYKSGWGASRYSAADTIEANFGRLVMRVNVNPRFAGKLIVGGMAGTRLPLIVTLFIIAVGLLTVSLLQLRRQQELARLRTEFVSGVSHELRTPLAQIRWFAELLHMNKLRSEEERARSAGIIDQEARRLTYLVENVLNFSRMEKGANRVSLEPADLDHEITEAVELFAPLARARRMMVAGRLDASVVVLIDRGALRQILLNLLDNAVKYGPVGQTIVVGSEIAGDRARIWVEDQGSGIPHEHRQRVWEPYVRLNRQTEATSGGSGIGLSVVRELVSLHGGRTRAEGAPGGGARIVIELPLTQGQSESPPGDPSPPSDSTVQLKAVP
ncbi:MAG TPA: HAMP domain-containing sensor histidine kinase [Gemmatimonadaceae bacterium]|jgi:signal transduction histidine kinase|nr:HAMP domain-containing sensor histidine kinase [Gemmatimonadaceae bacterium]